MKTSSLRYSSPSLIETEGKIEEHSADMKAVKPKTLRANVVRIGYEKYTFCFFNLCLTPKSYTEVGPALKVLNGKTRTPRRRIISATRTPDCKIIGGSSKAPARQHISLNLNKTTVKIK